MANLGARAYISEMPGAYRTRVHPILILLSAMIFAGELVPWLSERGLVHGLPGRGVMYDWFAFLNPSHPIWSLESHDRLVWGFMSYAFVHGDWLHLAMNLAAFIALGHTIVRLAGIGPFLAIFVVTTVSGAFGFVLISDHPGPLVGVSGAVFGFVAVLTAWQERELRHRGLSRETIWRRVAALVAINALFAFGLDGLLAWEAHLGGFVAGWAMAAVYPPRRAVLSMIG